jgi:transcriptional regulator with XRE-family HTH domain
MSLSDNIKTIREDKNIKQIEVATHIGVDKSAYRKIEKSTRALTVDELQKVAQLFGLTTDQIINHEGSITIPLEVVIEDKTTSEQLRLIAELEEEDKQTIFKLVDKMLTNKRLKVSLLKMRLVSKIIFGSFYPACLDIFVIKKALNQMSLKL